MPAEDPASEITHQGNCHCGTVAFSFEAEPVTAGLRCNCSICKRLGLVFSLAIPPAKFQVTRGRESTRTYQFGDRDITHVYCSQCGVYVFYQSEKQCRVNLGCVDAVDTFAITVHFYDGEHLL